MRPRRWLVLATVIGATVLLAGCFGDGHYTVGDQYTATQMTPGVYRSFGGFGCTLKKEDAAHNMTGIVAGGRVPFIQVYRNGPVYIQITSADKFVDIIGCSPFWRVYPPGPYGFYPLARPGQPFADGDFLVGLEVAPGIYQAPGISTEPRTNVCFWQRTDSLANPQGGIVQEGGRSPGSPVTVTIAGTDVMFSSVGCGTWTKIG